MPQDQPYPENTASDQETTIDQNDKPHTSLPPKTSFTPMSVDDANLAISEMDKEYRSKLLRMIEITLPQELRSHVSAEDILQDSFMAAYQQLTSGTSSPKKSALTWLRLIVTQQIVATHRKYCQTQKRNVAREVSIHAGLPNDDSCTLSMYLVGSFTSPSEAVQQHEFMMKVRDLIEELSPSYRRILIFKNFERLETKEIALKMNLSPNAVSAMSHRAVEKLILLLKRENLYELLAPGALR